MVGIDQGVELVQHARDLITAAACSAQQRRALFPSRKTKEALAYVREAKFGQTEHGSYVVTIASPIANATIDTQSAGLFLDPPFNRRVVSNLADALASIKATAVEVALSGRIESFDRTVSRGVSANLCDAVTGIMDVSVNNGAIFDFSWSAKEPADSNVPFRISMPIDSKHIIRDAARHFRLTHAREDYRLDGVVVALDRQPGELVGRVTVLGVLEEGARKIGIELHGEQYELAVLAHRDRRPVYCFGDLVKQGRMFSLRSPRQFSIDDEAEQIGLFETEGP